MISADCHAGGNHAQYREYLDPAYRDEFDAWRGKYKNPFRDLQDDGRTRNWDDERRNGDLDADGVVAEVRVPQHGAAVLPDRRRRRPAPDAEDFPRRLAGIRAHNRWLDDFVADAPERRAGLAQIFLNDVDDAVEDVRWGKEHGLVGVLLPGVSPDTPWIDPLFSPMYDPLWAVCQELDMPVTHHSGGSGIPNFGNTRSSTMMFVLETGFFANRALWHMMMSGVFDRFPGLKLVMTEQGSTWVPPPWPASTASTTDGQRPHRRARRARSRRRAQGSRASTSAATASSAPASRRRRRPRCSTRSASTT